MCRLIQDGLWKELISMFVVAQERMSRFISSPCAIISQVNVYEQKLLRIKEAVKKSNLNPDDLENIDNIDTLPTMKATPKLLLPPPPPPPAPVPPPLPPLPPGATPPPPPPGKQEKKCKDQRPTIIIFLFRGDYDHTHPSSPTSPVLHLEAKEGNAPA